MVYAWVDVNVADSSGLGLAPRQIFLLQPNFILTLPSFTIVNLFTTDKKSFTSAAVGNSDLQHNAMTLSLSPCSVTWLPYIDPDWKTSPQQTALFPVPFQMIIPREFSCDFKALSTKITVGSFCTTTSKIRPMSHSSLSHAY